MAAWQDAAQYGDIASGTTLTISYTTTTGADFLLARLVRYSGESVTSVKFNGVDMFFIGEQADDNNVFVVAVYGLRSPSIGTYNFEFVKSAGSEIAAAVVRSATGIEQSSNGASYRTPGKTSGYQGSVTVDVTTVSADLVFDGAIGSGFDLGSAGAGQTADHASTAIQGGSYRFATSTETASGTTTTMSWAGTATDVWGIIASALVPATGGGGNPAPGAGSATYTGNSSPMNYTMTPRTA